MSLGDPVDHREQPNKRKFGLYEKFRVERTDGKSARGEKHDGCDYFVLDLVHDDFARPALEAYATACATEYPRLAEDLRLRLAGKLPTYSDDPNNLRQPFAPRPPVPVQLSEERPSLPPELLAAARALLAEGPFHDSPPSLGALERLEKAVRDVGSLRPPDNDGSSWDCVECGTNVTGPAVANFACAHCGAMNWRRRMTVTGGDSTA